MPERTSKIQPVRREKNMITGSSSGKVKKQKGGRICKRMKINITCKMGVQLTFALSKVKALSGYTVNRLEQKRMIGLSFCATGYCVSTVGLDEETIRKYIRERNDSDK